MIVAATQAVGPTVFFAGLWIAFGIRIWVRWGQEERLSIAACFVAAALTVAFGAGWV